jgi:hypothetical protein
MCVSDGEEVHLESNMHQAVISEIEGGRGGQPILTTGWQSPTSMGLATSPLASFFGAILSSSNQPARAVKGLKANARCEKQSMRGCDIFPVA